MAVDASDQGEYLDASENVRHQTNVFFAHVTLFTTITGALVAYLDASDTPPCATNRFVAYLAGCLAAATFWVNGEVYLYRSRHFERRAAALESVAGDGQYATMHEARRRFRPGLWAWRALFGAIGGYWAFNVLRYLGLPPWSAGLSSIAGVAGFQYAVIRGGDGT